MKTKSVPTLTIVAGPNGAGKSSISQFISPKDAFVFDPDREHARVRQQNPIWPEESVLYARDMYFGDQVDFVLMNKRSFTIETNLRDTELFNTVDRFKQAGYITGIVFMMLANVGQSMERVNNRVKEGGHFVDPGSIRQNYELGLQNLQQYADRFDHIEILNAAGDPISSGRSSVCMKGSWFINWKTHRNGLQRYPLTWHRNLITVCQSSPGS